MFQYQRKNIMAFASLLYGVLVYLLSFGTILYTIAFVGNLLYRGFDALRDQYRGSRA